MSRLVRGAKPLCIAMAVIAAVMPGPAGVQRASAAPADIFQSAAPMPGAGAPKATEVKAGDASVATETGAMQYGFPIAVPPGRQGAQPSLSLGYSSQGSIYGGLAAGWSLSIPMIAENTMYGRLRTHYGLAEAQQSDPRFDDLFTSSLAGGRTLHKVDELAALPANTYGFYRAQNDSSFARYERMNASSTFRWRVLTTDGGTLYFGDNGSDAAGACSSILSDGYAPLTKTVDSFGNSVRYKYAWEPTFGECRIDTISYGANANAGLADFAKVSFVYNANQACTVGGTSAVGSQSSYRTGTKIVTGVAGIGKIKAESFPNGLAGAVAHTREITLTYDSPGFVAGSCNAAHAPYRILTSVQESAWGADLTVMPRVDLPAVTMEYGSALINRNVATASQALPGGKRLDYHWPSVDKMLIDVNGDGVLDAVTSTPDLNANGKETVCKATWTSGAGGTGSGVITMPMLPWNFNGAALQFGEPGDCSLNSQRTHLFNNSTTGCDTAASASDHLGTQLAYRWMDIDDDGMIDIVASIQLDGCYVPDGGAQPLPLGLPTLPSDAQGLYCPSTQAPQCSTMYNNCWSFSGGCSSNGALCNPDWASINQNSCVQTQRLDCRATEFYDGPATLPAVPALPLRPVNYQASDDNLVSFGRCGKYPWFVYKNTNGIFPTTPNIKWQPVPLEAEQGDASLGGGPYSAAKKSISDIDGDGNPDSFVVGAAMQAVDYPYAPAWWWNTFLGDGNGGFSDSNYLFRAPDGKPISTSEWVYGGITPTNNQVSTDMLMTNTLMDINSDGLPDYVSSPKNGTSYNLPVNVAFNDGTGFRLHRTTADPTLHGERQLPSQIHDFGRNRIVNGIYVSGTNKYGIANKPSAPGYYTDGDKVTMERWMDVDADGRVDLVSMGASPTGTPTVYYNTGDNLGPGAPMIGAAAVLQAPQRVTVKNDPKTWNTTVDFIDLNGDGITEFYESNAPSYSVAAGFRYDPLGKPPRLLHTIRNGRGADTVITYTHMNDSTTVVQDPANGKATNKSRWVVKSVLNTDALTKTDNAGNASFSATTLYKYLHPRTMPDEGKYDFRGFSEVQVTGPTGAVTKSRYQYDNCGANVLCDPTGRLFETVTLHAGGTVANTVNTTSWVDRSVFDRIAPSWNGIVTYFALESKSYICAAGQTESSCRSTPAAFTKTVNTISPIGTSASGNTLNNYLAWMVTATTLKGGDTAVATDGDRTTTTTYTHVADATNWRIRPTSVTKTVRVAGAAQTYAKAETIWDATKRFVDESRSWINNTAADVLVTKFTYDAQTGNQLTVQKPQQVAENSLLKTTRTYDANRLFVIGDVNEMNLVMDYVTEPGTGVTLATKGPNDRTCTACPITATSLARQEHRIKIDGLGRTREIWDTPSSQGYTYDLYLVGRNTYTDTVNLTSAPKVGPRVLSEKLLEIGLSTWTQERTETDGHGRAIIKTTFAQGSVPVDAVSTFFYGNDSTLRWVTLPDPTLNTAAVVKYTYTYDSLGRPLTMRRPDNAVVASQSGIDIAYDGVTQTTTEIVGASGGKPAKKITVSDTFGRLSQVQERMRLGPELMATTTYTYAADDTVRTINDPENVLTTLTHDFAGRRTAITRAGKTWTYNYDRNGNLASEVVPGTAPAGDLMRFTNTMTYDAGDRMITKVLGSRGMSAADQTLFGTGSMTFLWDYGANRAGRLRYARSFAPGVNTATATPILLEEYQYNAKGDVTFMYHTFNSGGYSNLSRAFGRSFQPWGGVQTTYYRDYMGGGTNETQSTVRYDARAMPTYVDLIRPGETTQQVANQTRNVAGLVTKRKTTQLAATGAMPWVESNWVYDSLGRVSSQTVQKSANTGGTTEQVAKQTLGYFGNDDPSSLVHVLGAAGATANTKTYAFTYDNRHQLQTAIATQSGSGTGQRLNQSFVFGAGGRFTRATVNNALTAVAGTGSDIKRRDVDYVYGNADKEQVTQLKKTGTATAYANYAYDDAGNQTQRSYPAGTLLNSPSESGNAETFDYVYDGDDRLRRVVKKVTGVVAGSEEYWYDNGGQRIAVLKRNASGVVQELRWFIGDTQAHYDAAGVVTKTYAHVALGTPVARVERTSNTATTFEYQFHGLASNMISAVSTAGVVNVNVAYAPYGETVESQQPAGAAGTAVGMPAHRRRMNDKYVDEIGSLAYYGARYYDNVLIGWTQGDPMYRFAPDAAWKDPRRANLYQFTLSNPIRYVDPDGRDAKKVYQVQFSDLSVPDSTMNLAEARTAVIQAIQALPSGRMSRELSKNGLKMGEPSRGSDKINSLHSNIVLIDASSKGQRDAASAVNAGQKGNVTLLQEDKSAPAAANISGTEITIGLDRVQAEIDKINSRTDLSDEQKLAAIQAKVSNMVNHEGVHNLGVGHNKDSGNQKNLMSPELTPYPWADITPDESDAIKRDLERRRYWDGY